jgi:hypothetical protein
MIALFFALVWSKGLACTEMGSDFHKITFNKCTFTGCRVKRPGAVLVNT